MGVAIIPKKTMIPKKKPTPTFNKNQYGHTEELVSWITNLRCKRNNFKRKRNRNIHIEAILNSAISRSETELRYKQQQRYKKWQLIKYKLLNNKLECDTPKSSELEIDKWDSKTREDLNSLHTFISMLNEVKTTVER